jgi:hypothetical protein
VTPTHRLLADGSLVFPVGYDAAEIEALSAAEIADVDLNAARRIKLGQVSSAFSRQIMRGCSSPKGLVDCDDKACNRVANAIFMRDKLGVPAEDTENWTMHDGSKIEHDYAELVALGAAIATGFKAYFAQKQAIEQAIGAATSTADVAAIDINSGWPQ